MREKKGKKREEEKKGDREGLKRPSTPRSSPSLKKEKKKGKEECSEYRKESHPRIYRAHRLERRRKKR